jgi:hypothetical protein
LERKLAIIYKLIINPDREFRATGIHPGGGKTNRPISKLYSLKVTETIEVSRSSIQPESNVSD